MTIGSMAKIIVTAAGGALGAFLGGTDSLIYTLLAFVIIDYLTGVIAAGKHRKLNSNIGFWGIIKKILIFVVVGIGVLLDKYLIGQGGTFRTAAIFFYLANECLSVLENCVALDLPVPGKLINMLEQLKANEKRESDDNN